MRGDILIDDKPNITGSTTPTWQQARARHALASHAYAHARPVRNLYCSRAQLIFTAPYNRHVSHLARLDSWDEWEARVESCLVRAHVADAAVDEDDGEKEAGVTKREVDALPDFSHLLPANYRNDYMSWRAGGQRGAKGEAADAATAWEMMQDSALNNAAEDFTELVVFRKGYSNWRRGGVSGARNITMLRHEFWDLT